MRHSRVYTLAFGVASRELHTTNTAFHKASLIGINAVTADRFLQAHPELQFIDLLMPDINGIVRGKRVDAATLPKVFESGIALPASIFAMNIQGTTVEETGLGLDIGEADRVCLPVPGTLCMEPWQRRPTAQLLLTMYELDRKTPFFADPRVVLEKVLQRFSSLELTPVTAFELEFYLIDQENLSGRPQPPKSPLSGKRPAGVQAYSIDDLDEYADFLADVLDAAHQQGLPADAFVAESAPGQFEINLHHVDDTLRSCDNATLLKRLIKNMAYDHEMDTTFMAKPYHDQAGSGMHLHVSLCDRDGRNVFAGDAEQPNDLLRWAVGGVLATMNEAMALFCPNINSYRRFSPEYYVASAATWGVDNRTTALRLPGGDAEALRVEHRVAGADANPYLVMAAVLAGMHYGIEHKIEPPSITAGNAHEQHEATLVNNLRDGLRELGQSTILEEYLGRDFLDVFIACKEHELTEFERTISDLEYLWYLHTV